MLQESSQFNLKCLSVELWRKKDINKNMEFSDWIYYSIIENIKGHYFFSIYTRIRLLQTEGIKTIYFLIIYVFLQFYIFEKEELVSAMIFCLHVGPCSLAELFM